MVSATEFRRADMSAPHPARFHSPDEAALSEDFWWVDTPAKSTMLFASVPIIDIEPCGAGWRAKVVLAPVYVVPQQATLVTKEDARRWADTWVRQRLVLLARVVARVQVAEHDRSFPSTN